MLGVLIVQAGITVSTASTGWEYRLGLLGVLGVQARSTDWEYL